MVLDENGITIRNKTEDKIYKDIEARLYSYDGSFGIYGDEHIKETGKWKPCTIGYCHNIFDVIKLNLPKDLHSRSEITATAATTELLENMAVKKADSIKENIRKQRQTEKLYSKTQRNLINGYSEENSFVRFFKSLFK